jgi:hypothetical protein
MDTALKVETFYRVFRDISILVHSRTSLKEMFETTMACKRRKYPVRYSIQSVINLRL